VNDRLIGIRKRVQPADLVAGSALFLSAFLFFYDLFEGRFLLTERDLGPYFIPPRAFWVESLKRLDFPFWSPYQFSGYPFFANPQHGLFYPLNVLLLLFPFDVAFNVTIVLHFFLGGLFLYLFLKDLKAGRSSALLSALIFMLSGYLLSVHSLLSVFLSGIWTPLIMMFFRRALASRRWTHRSLTALFMTLSFLGGGIEIVYGNFLLLLFMALFSQEPPAFRPGEAKPRLDEYRGPSLISWSRWEYLFVRFRSLIVVFLFFIFLSAIQLVPFLELFFHSIRGKGISYQEATLWSFAPKDVLLFFLPDAYGYFLDMKKYWVAQCWFKTLYTGGLPFILSLLFFLRGRGRRLFFSLMLLSIFLALGRYNPLYPYVFHYVPFFNGIRYPAKFLYLFILVLSITAGLGFQRLTEFSERGEKNPYMKHVSLLLSVLSGLVLLSLVMGHQEIVQFLKEKGIDSPDFNPLSVNLYHGKRFFFYLTLYFLLIRVGFEKEWKRWVKGLLLFVLIADLFGNTGFYGREKTPDYFEKTEILERITADGDFFRVFSTKKTIGMDTPVLIGNATPLSLIKEKHLPSLNSLHRIHDIWGVDVIRLKRVDDLYKAFTEAPSITATNLIDLYGIRYIISVTPLEEGGRFKLIYARLDGLQGREGDLIKENTIKLYRYSDPSPRGWLVGRYRVLKPEAILSEMAKMGFRPEQEVFLEETPSLPPVQEGGAGGKGRVEMLSEGNNRLDLLVRSETDALLVVNDTHFPGWKAYVDGKEEKIYCADYIFRAVAVPAGTHRVAFVYHPLSFKIGAAMTLIGIGACVAGAVHFRSRRRK
jgi:hypothetical protein